MLVSAAAQATGCPLYVKPVCAHAVRRSAGERPPGGGWRDHELGVLDAEQALEQAVGDEDAAEGLVAGGHALGEAEDVGLDPEDLLGEAARCVGQFRPGPDGSKPLQTVAELLALD